MSQYLPLLKSTPNFAKTIVTEFVADVAVNHSIGEVIAITLLSVCISDPDTFELCATISLNLHRHLVARSVGRRQLPLGERSQVTVHLRFELGLIREPVIQHLPRLFERLAEVEHLLKLRAGIGHRRRINVLEEDEDLRSLRFPSPLLLPTGQRAVKLFFCVR